MATFAPSGGEPQNAKVTRGAEAFFLKKLRQTPSEMSLAHRQDGRLLRHFNGAPPRASKSKSRPCRPKPVPQINKSARTSERDPKTEGSPIQTRPPDKPWSPSMANQGGQFSKNPQSACFGA